MLYFSHTLSLSPFVILTFIPAHVFFFYLLSSVSNIHTHTKPIWWHIILYTYGSQSKSNGVGLNTPVCIISLQIQHALVSNYNVQISLPVFVFLFLFISPVKRTLQYIQVNLKANLNESNHTNAKPINFSLWYICSHLSDLGRALELEYIM